MKNILEILKEPGAAVPEDKQETLNKAAAVSGLEETYRTGQSTTA